MKPASAVLIHRTVHDGDPVLVHLTTRTDAGVVAVADDATVSLRVKIAGSVVVIVGVGQGSGSGVWAFSPALLPTEPGRLPYSITVNSGSVEYTHGNGFIDLGDRV